MKRAALLALGLAALAAVPHGPIRAVLRDPPTIAALHNAAWLAVTIPAGLTWASLCAVVLGLLAQLRRRG